MKVAIDQLAAKLESVLGTGAVESNSRTLASYTVDGKFPSILCTPGDPEQVSAALRICAEADASVVPWGGGTAKGPGNIPRRANVVIEIKRLNGLIEHDDATLTASAQAGMRGGRPRGIPEQRNQVPA